VPLTRFPLLLQAGFQQTIRWSLPFDLLQAWVWSAYMTPAQTARSLLSVVGLQVLSSFTLDYLHRTTFLASSSSGKNDE
jgi:hypothetical protein